MKRLIATFCSVLLLTGVLSPATSAAPKYEVNQRTLASFSGNSTLLTAQQRAQVRATVEANPNAEKFICTGIRFHSQPMSTNIMVRKRAKAACDYAKELNPNLSTWFQNKPTRARSYAGKVLLTVKSPTQPPSLEEAPVALPPNGSDPIERCMIKEVSNNRGMTGAGFPEWVPLTPKSGTVKWALIPIDFPDMRGESNFRLRVDNQMELLTEWFDSVSQGRFKVEWVVADRWMTLPGKTSEYMIPRSVNVNDAVNGPKLFVDAMAAADPHFDFTGVQTVNFILPSGQKFIGEGSQGFPWDEVVKNYTSDEGKIASYSIPGAFFDVPGREYWSYWAHEFGHAIGLPHIGESRGQLPPFNPWDLMGGQDGPSRELSGWLRFLAGWLDNSQIYCKEASSIESIDLTLVSLSENREGVKFAVLPVSETKALLIESRRETKFSCRTQPSRNGVLVYTYDATLGHNQDFLMPVSPPNRPVQRDSCESSQVAVNSPNPDFLLRNGDAVTVEGFRVEVLTHGQFSDTIRVSRD